MKKSTSLIIIILITILFTIPYCSPSTYAITEIPIITSPIQYDEISPYDNLTITWQAPTIGTVSKYIVSIRQLKILNEADGNNILILNQA